MARPARTQSAVLSATDKKAQIADLKGQIKIAKTSLKGLSAARKDADKLYAQAGKDHIAALKANDKEVAAINKAVDGYTAKLAVLQPAKEATTV